MANRRSKDFKDAMEYVCFFITISRQPTTDHQSKFVIKAVLGSSSPNSVVPSFEVALEHGMALQDLEAVGVVGVSGAGEYDVHYSGTITVDRKRAELMARMFRIIEDGTSKLEDDLGVPLSFGQYMARLAKVLGVKKFLFSMPAGDVASVDTREAISRIDMLAQELAQEQSGGTTHHHTSA